jgi:hypothetical protein
LILFGDAIKNKRRFKVSVTVQSQKAEFFQIMDKWGNAKIAQPPPFKHTGSRSISSLPRQSPFPNIAVSSINERVRG